MSDIVTPIDTLSNDNLKKRFASQIALEDWTDECSKCGYPKLLHKDHVCIVMQHVPGEQKSPTSWKKIGKLTPKE